MTVTTIPAPVASRPRHDLPGGACDSHSHVFGPFDRFSPLQPSAYALPDANPAVHADIRGMLGVTRGVLTQPAPYADDPSAMLNALAESGGALRAVAVASPDIEATTLARWREGGVVGLRFVEQRAPGGGRYPGSIGFDAIAALAPTMRSLGLHAQLWAPARVFAESLSDLVRLGIPLVLDHMGSPDIGADPDDTSFTDILSLLRDEPVWVKLVTARVGPAGDERVHIFHQALVDAAPNRCLWGSDWPFVRMTPSPDAGVALDQFMEWVPDPGRQQAILVDNPARLYGFGEVR